MTRARMRRVLPLLLLLPVPAIASGVVKAEVSSTHFKRTAQTVMGITPEGMPDEKGWVARAEQQLRAEVDRLEAALPRVRQGYPAANLIVPLSDPTAIRRRIDLSGKGWGWVELAFREEPSSQELEALRRALAQELQLQPLDRRRFRPVPILFGAMAVIAAAVLTGMFVRSRRRRRRAKGV